MAKSPSLLDLLAMLPAGDIARTARSLGLSPELLRKRLAAIEATLGVDLLGSATRVLAPTETGRLVLEHASRILSQARDFTRDLEELAGLQAPAVNLGADMFVAQLPLGATLGRMVTANSRLRARVVVADFDHIARAVIGGELEFGVSDTEAAARQPARLAIDPVAEYPLRFFVRPGHPLVAGAAPSLETILVFPLATSRIPQRIAVHLAGALRSCGRTRRPATCCLRLRSTTLPLPGVPLRPATPSAWHRWPPSRPKSAHASSCPCPSLHPGCASTTESFAPAGVSCRGRDSSSSRNCGRWTPHSRRPGSAARGGASHPLRGEAGRARNAEC